MYEIEQFHTLAKVVELTDKSVNVSVSAILDLDKEIQMLQDRLNSWPYPMIHEFEDALKLYANPKNWEQEEIDIGIANQKVPGTSLCEMDRGKVAQLILDKWIRS